MNNTSPWSFYRPGRDAAAEAPPYRWSPPSASFLVKRRRERNMRHQRPPIFIPGVQRLPSFGKPNVSVCVCERRVRPLCRKCRKECPGSPPAGWALTSAMTSATRNIAVRPCRNRVHHRPRQYVAARLLGFSGWTSASGGIKCARLILAAPLYFFKKPSERLLRGLSGRINRATTRPSPHYLQCRRKS